MSRKVKKRVFEILEMARSQDLPSRVVDIFIIVLIVLNVIAVILESIHPLSTRYALYFHEFEVFSVAVFTLEYLLHLWSCTTDKSFERPIAGRIRFALTPLALIDLVAILPFYLPMIFALDLRFVRILRLFRVLRLFKMARYSESLKTLGNVLNQLSAISYQLSDHEPKTDG